MKKVIFLLSLIIIFSTWLISQKASADIYGSVMLPDGSKIPGVLVTLSGEKIGKITTVTSEKGNYRFLKLHPSTYQLKFELEGFTTIIRKGIRLYVGKNITLNIELQTTTIREEMVITEKPSTVDVRKTTAGVNISKERIESLPTARNPWTILNLVPGIMMDREDVGGNESGQQSNFYGMGSFFGETSWNIDEANASTGAAPVYLDVSGYEEIQVTLGSNDISYQTGGVQLNYVTKRGANHYSGDLHLYVEDSAWELTQDLPQYYIDQGYVFPGLNRLYQYGINFGGAIIRDKWWWLGSWSNQDIHARTESGDEDATLLTSSYLKSNFQLGHTSGEFHISYNNKRKWGRFYLTRAQQDESSLWDEEGPYYSLYGRLQHVAGNLMITAKVLYSDSSRVFDPRGSDIDSDGHNTGLDWLRYQDPVYYGGSSFHAITDDNTVDLSLDGNYFAEDLLGGDHEIRFGIDYFHSDQQTQTLFPNQRVAYSFFKEDPSAFQSVWLIPDSYLDASFSRTSLYLADTATFGRFTINAGLRYDKETGRLNQRTLKAFTWHEPGSPYHGVTLFPDYLSSLTIQAGDSDLKYSVLSPRLSITYDISGEGKTVIKLSAARYGSHAGDQLNLANWAFREIDVLWLDDGDLIPEYEELVLGDQSKNDAIWENVSLIDYSTGWKRISVDDNFNSPLLDELTLSFEKSLGEDISVSLTGFYKRRYNLLRQIGILEDGRLETEANNWYYAGDYTFSTGETVPYYLRHEKPETVFYTNYDSDTFQQYLALQLIFSKKLSNKWMLDASFTYADWKAYYKKEEYGVFSNWGVFAGDLTNYDFYNGGVPSMDAWRTNQQITVNARWMVKVSGLYQLPWGINATAVLNAREGYVIAYHEYMDRPGLGWTQMYKPGTKLGDDRLPAFWMLNLGLEKSFKISETTTITFFLNGYNITNNVTTLKVETNLEDDNFDQPLQVLNPGIFQFGVRLKF